MAGLSEPWALLALDSSWVKRQVPEKATSQSPVAIRVLSQQDAIHSQVEAGTLQAQGGDASEAGVAGVAGLPGWYWAYPSMRWAMPWEGAHPQYFPALCSGG